MPANTLPQEIDTAKLAEAALAILSLTLHDDGRVWKGLDWDPMDLLHEKGWIVDPQTKAKSVVLTEDGDGERLATEFLRKHFGRGATARVAPAGRDPLTSCSPDPELLAIMEIRP
jgi:hypothetical protein